MKWKSLIPLLAILACISCQPVKYIPLPSSHSKLDMTLRYDSVSRDVVHYMWVAGDTVYKLDSIHIYHYVHVGDTVVIHDSIPTPVPVPVPGEMTKHQQFMYNSGQIAWIILAVAIVVGAIILIIKSVLKR